MRDVSACAIEIVDTRGTERPGKMRDRVDVCELAGAYLQSCSPVPVLPLDHVPGFTRRDGIRPAANIRIVASGLDHFVDDGTCLLVLCELKVCIDQVVHGVQFVGPFLAGLRGACRGRVG